MQPFLWTRISSRYSGFFWLFLVGTLAALLTRFFVVENFRVASPSMVPSLLKGDFVFVNKSAFNLRIPFSNYEILRLRDPKRGEIVAFSLPNDPSIFVKRVVALAGERVTIRDGHLQVQGVLTSYDSSSKARGSVQESWGNNVSYPIKSDHSNYGPIDIPKGYVFVLGDNREDSVDSRAWGPVPQVYLRGKVVWSVSL